MLIPSEKADDLKAGVILLTSNIRHPGPISVSTDSASGFASLSKGDKQLQDLNITITTRDEFNKNFNAVVDHACQELEAEIRKQANSNTILYYITLYYTLSPCVTKNSENELIR